MPLATIFSQNYTVIESLQHSHEAKLHTVLQKPWHIKNKVPPG